jgi:FkbM family methyltransferase
MSSEQVFEIYNGKKIHTHSTKDYISNAIATYKCWEPNISYFIDNLFKESEVFFDVGGNIGYYSIAFSDNFKKIYCFEPNPANTQKIQKSIMINKIENLSLINQPVAQFSNVYFSAFDRNNVKNSNIGGIQYVENKSGEMKTISLDDFIEENRVEKIDLLKVDIEGGELGCLLGCKKSIDKRKVKNIIIEITPKFSIEDSKKILFFLSEKYELFNLGLKEVGKVEQSNLKIYKILDIDSFISRVRIQTNIYCKLKSEI